MCETRRVTQTSSGRSSMPPCCRPLSLKPPPFPCRLGEPVTFSIFRVFAHPDQMFFKPLHKIVILRACDAREKKAAVDVPSVPTTVLSFGSGPLFRNPLLFVIPPAPACRGSVPGFPTHRSHPRQQMWFSLREPRAVDRSRNSRQEIRGSRGTCSAPFGGLACAGLA